MTPLEVLRAAKARISRPECWVLAAFDMAIASIEQEKADDNS